MKGNSCLDCKHLDKETMTSCTAFPKGVPFSVDSGAIPHDKPLRGQKNKVVFERIEE